MYNEINTGFFDIEKRKIVAPVYVYGIARFTECAD